MHNRLAETDRTTGPRVVDGLAWFAALTVLSALFALAVLAPAWGAGAARVQAFNERGFGRIVLTFDKLPAYQNELASGVFVLTFEQPVEIDLSGIADRVADYVVVARRDPDGRAIRLALSRSFRVNVMEAGNQLFVDLLPPEWRGAAPGLPIDVVKDLARKAAEAEEKAREEARQRRDASVPYKLDVRTARHPTFTRLVFDWNQFVTVNLSRDGGTVVLEFGARAPVDLSRLKTEMPPFMQSVQTLERREGMAVEIRIDDDTDVRGFREGWTYVVDLTGADAALDKAVRPAAAAAQGAPAPAAAKGADAVVLPGGEGRATAGPSAADARASQLESGDIVDIGEGEAATPSTPAKAQSGETVPAPPQAGAGPGSPGDAAPAVTRQASSAAHPVEPAAAGAAIRVEGSGENLRIVFPFAEPVAAAIFRRGRVLWAVFETDASLDAGALRTASNDMIAGAEHMRAGPLQYFRIGLSHPWLTYAAESNNAWIVSVGNMVTGKAEALNLARQLREDKRSLMSLKLERAGRLHWLKDPDLGDQVAVLTAFGPPRHVAKSQDLVEFEALGTAHGVAIAPKTEDIAVRLTLGELLVTRREGLTISAGTVAQYVPGRKVLADTGRPGFLDFHAWRATAPGELSGRLRDLQVDIALSPPEQRASLRYELARTYLANGLAAETLGVARLMAQEHGAVENDPSFNALRGAAQVLMRRTSAARKDLSVHALANDPHASLWRGMIAGQERDWEQALRAFDDGADAVASYPSDLQARFRLIAARAALETDRHARAAAELAAIPDEALPADVNAEARVLMGRYYDRVGRTEEALEAYVKVLKGTHEPSKAEAQLLRIQHLLKTGKMKRDEALSESERLQLFWRGDDIELGTLRLLADLYVKEERFRDAFEVMRKAALAFPGHRMAERIQDDMKLVFEDLYLHGKSDRMRAVDAVSLYYEHREMTPVGRLGDEMIRKLADRLISVDLLDQAAELLEHQVDKRLGGAARAQVATRLGMVHLMNRKPEMALRAIRRTRQAGLPATLLHSRSLLEARALGELGRADAAIEILNTMEGPEAERLKADALWTGQQWARAGEQLERILGTRWQEPEPLSDRERFDALRAAISYSLADDQFALDRLRQKFFDKMAQTRDADSFAMVTRPVKPDAATLRKLAREIAAIDTLDAFMKDFRSRFDLLPEPPREAAAPVGGGAG